MTIDEAIKHCNEVVEQCTVYFQTSDNEVTQIPSQCAEEHRQLAEWLKELKRVREQTRWIPAEEAIPEDGKDVLVWYEFYAYGDLNKMVHSFGIGHVYHGFWSGDVQGTKSKCLAWMPLPEPYKKEGEAE